MRWKVSNSQSVIQEVQNSLSINAEALIEIFQNVKGKTVQKWKQYNEANIVSHSLKDYFMAEYSLYYSELVMRLSPKGSRPHGSHIPLADCILDAHNWEPTKLF